MPLDLGLMAKQRAARLARDAAAEALKRERRTHEENAPSFFDNIDTSGGLDACHEWTGCRKWNHSEAGATSYEHGFFDYEGCVSRISTRVLCFATFGREPPRGLDITPLCGNHLCMNLRHLCVTPHGGGDRLSRATPVEEFFRCEAVAA